MDSVNYSENCFNLKKDELLSLFFSGKITAFSAAFKSLVEMVEACETLTENTQKALNQIRYFISQKKELLNFPKLHVLFNRLSNALTAIVRHENRTPVSVTFDDWKTGNRLTENQLEPLFKTTMTFQITSGCSNYCKRCNEWALPGARKHFSFEAVKRFSESIFKTGNTDFIYYGASDPLDWADGDKTINDIIDFLSKTGQTPKYDLLTKLPVGKSHILEKLIQQKAGVAISQTNKNRKRIRQLEEKTGVVFSKQHDNDDLMIPAGRDEDFSTVKPSITDSYGSEITPDGAYIIVPSFTSALNLTGQKRIPVTKNTTWLLLNKTGLKGLSVLYFKPFEAVRLSGEIFRLDKLLDVQVENILLDSGSENLTPPGMMNLREFFKTFEKESMRRKKRILPSVISDLKEKHLNNKSYRAAENKIKNDFKKELADYLTICSEKKMSGLVKYAFSYFLTAISGYLNQNEHKKNIILHLNRIEKSRLASEYPHLFEADNFEQFFDAPEIENFVLFRILSLRLLANPDEPSVIGFTLKYPAVFDEGKDLFVKQVKQKELT